MVSVQELFVQMMSHPPDANEPQPLVNRPSTMHGLATTFFILSTIAVLLRLYTRIRVVRDAGWDDVLIALSGVFNTAAFICGALAVKYGMGKHWAYLSMGTWINYLKMFYLLSSIYFTNTTIVKMSLLVQYLRIFKQGFMRYICLGLLVAVGLWGLAFSFMAWFPCFPVTQFWVLASRTSKCYGFGFSDKDTYIALFEAHAALNMAFDLAIFLVPMRLFNSTGSTRQSLAALAGILLFGSIVVVISIWRLYTIAQHKAATAPYPDFTWWAPLPIILSFLEVNVAIICASMPVFWPVIEARFTQIFVTNEVRVEHHRIDDTYEMEGTASVKSGASVERLTKNMRVREEGNARDPFSHYKDHYVAAQVDPLSETGLGTDAGCRHSGHVKQWRA